MVFWDRSKKKKPQQPQNENVTARASPAALTPWRKLWLRKKWATQLRWHKQHYILTAFLKDTQKTYLLSS